jgi:hypothetical protein
MHWSSDQYSRSIFDLVEAVYYEDYPDGKEGEKEKKRKVDSAYKACKVILKGLRDLKNPPKFADVFAYARFIRNMEFVYMYQNTENAPICCDRFNDTECTLFFPYDDRNTYIKLNMYYDSSEAQRLVITVYREYGHKDTTTFKVTNGIVDFKTDDEVMLANTVNAYVQNTMGMIYETYMELAYHGAIYDTVVGGANG